MAGTIRYTDGAGAGYVLAVVSALTFSAKGIFAKILYAGGVDPVTLLALRFAIALPLFWATLFFFPSGKVTSRDIFALAASGIIGFYLSALADFWGLKYIGATLERVILYTYPAMVAVLAHFFFKERVGGKKIMSIVVTYAGLALVLKAWSAELDTELLGAGLVLLAAVIYSFNFIITEVVSRRVSGVKIAAYTSTAATCAFMGTWRFSYVPTDPGVWTDLVLLAVVSTYLPVLTFALGVKRLGARRFAFVSFIGPVSTAVLANIFLGETLDAVQLAGMALVIGGVLALSAGKGER